MLKLGVRKKLIHICRQIHYSLFSFCSLGLRSLPPHHLSYFQAPTVIVSVKMLDTPQAEKKRKKNKLDYSELTKKEREKREEGKESRSGKKKRRKEVLKSKGGKGKVWEGREQDERAMRKGREEKVKEKKKETIFCV